MQCVLLTLTDLFIFTLYNAQHRLQCKIKGLVEISNRNAILSEITFQNFVSETTKNIHGPQTDKCPLRVLE